MAPSGLNEVQRRIGAAARAAGRSVDEVRLVAISKGRTVDEIMAVYEQGHREFGENRAHELAEKAPQLPDDIVWHFVGTLQRRQAKLARPYTTLLHSLDRPALVDTWAREPHAPPALVQVNLAEEPQKHGARVGEVEPLLERAARVGLACIGLMLIPPLPERAEDSRPWFRELARLRDDLSERWPALRELSMGMTDDFEVAVEEGATLVRVGRAIFGPTKTT